MEIINRIKTEENIDDTTFLDFSRSIALAKGSEIYNRGLAMLRDCSEEEKLCAFVYLFKLAEADESISMREIRLLMDALDVTKVDFKDVVISSDLASSSDRAKS